MVSPRQWGLASHADGLRVELSPSGIIESDASLPVHGFAVVDSPSLEQAAEVASLRGPAHFDALLEFVQPLTVVRQHFLGVAHGSGWSPHGGTGSR